MSWQDNLTPKQRATADKVVAAANRHGVPSNLALAMAMQESTLNQNKRSKTGPTGVMMLGRKASKDLGIDRFNEDQNIEGGVRYMKALLDKHGGDVDRALVAYHDGPNSAYFKGGEMSPAAANHIQKVKGYADMAEPKSPSKFNVTIEDVEPIKPLEFTDTGTGDIYGSRNDLGLGDWLSGGVGAAAGAKFGPNRKRSIAEIEAQRANAQRVIQENRAAGKAHEEQLKEIQRQENYALELRNQAMQAAKEAQANNPGQDARNWMYGQYGSDISSVEGRNVLNQKEAEAAGKAGVARTRQAQAMMPGAGPDPITGIWLSPEQLATRPAPAPAPTMAERFPLPPPMARPPYPEQKPIPPVHTGSRMGTLSNALAGGVAAQQGTSAVDKAAEGNLLGAGLSALTAGGAGATMVPGLSPKAKAAAAAGAAGSAGLNYLYNKYLDKKDHQQPESVLQKTPTYADGGRISKKAIEAARGPLTKLSEWAQNHINEFFVPTQADRMGGVGGPSYSANQLIKPEYQNRTWGSGQPATATGIANLAKDPQFGGPENQIFAPLLGDPNMHQSNQLVHDMLMREFYKNSSQMTPELRNKINTFFQQGGPLPSGKTRFDPIEGFDIMDKKQMRELGDTFAMRKAISAHAFGGEALGGRKAQIIPYEDILHSTRDPLTHEAPTFSMGPRAFRLTGDVEPVPRPDLNKAYPIQLMGEDLGVTYTPVPSELALRDFQSDWRKNTGKTSPLKSGALPQPGYYEHTLGYTPTGSSQRIYPRQKITEDWIKDLQKSDF